MDLSFVPENKRPKGLSKGKFATVFPELPENVVQGNGLLNIYDYESIFEDEATKRIIREGETIGCFYIESPGMRSLLRRLNCDTFEMLTAASSIIRPGVSESGMMREFIARHKDPSRINYLLPEMEEYLHETYGVMIYQEDVIKIAHHVVGLSLEEADLLRRAMSGKMRSKTAMERLEERFVFSCKEKGFSDHVVGELWKQIASFAGYAFCKAHSASYALLSFQVAYLKVHYPAEFMASVLNNGGGYYSPAVYIRESKRLGIKILLPCINESEYRYKPEGMTIRIGFLAIKGFPKATAERIIAERKRNGRYKTLPDFLIRVNSGYEETVLLIKCGAMGSFKITRPALLRLLDVYFHYRSKGANLFANEMFELEREVATERQYNAGEICALEFELFGYMTTRHPLAFFPELKGLKGKINAADMLSYNGRRVKIAGWYMTSKRIRTQKGDIMKFLSLEDYTGTFEAVLFPDAYSRYASKTLSYGPYLIEGIVDTENGYNIIVEKLEVLSERILFQSIQKDSVENKYYGEQESATEEEISIVNSLGKGALRRAYL